MSLVPIMLRSKGNNGYTLILILPKMANRKDQLKGGISAMFGEGQPAVPQPQVITEDQYAELERRQSDRRYFMTGRKKNDDTSDLLTKNDIRTSMILEKDQYDLLKEIALREAMTIKDLAFAMFKLGIDAYEKKHGKVVLRGNATKRELF